ncbi:MAG: retroviral-like aspartic protease family protein [Novosphingobium sp.]|nr:retroviral-like aspartic protease family protein [Novosphingobium sp.]
MVRVVSFALAMLFAAFMMTPRHGTAAQGGADRPAAHKHLSPWGTPTASGPIRITRGYDNAFHLTGEINGQDADFIVDTGASYVALSMATAERLNLDTKTAEFRPMIRTASGG